MSDFERAMADAIAVATSLLHSEGETATLEATDELVSEIVEKGRAHGAMLAQARLTLNLLNAITRAQGPENMVTTGDSLLREIGRHLIEAESRGVN
ncbi:hypothetical protein GCM10011509_10550 [Ornithinimicrobium pekingense]|uniref:DUF1844 domain-containing protein n=2 Tax=Ornithinimicrobium pekingense TaxID=384677 RepID=A0ABQ2F6C7_9MICO|nr:hypothetical protein GCM10011509_10550 [Ornithinimicrobium pekingense]